MSGLHAVPYDAETQVGVTKAFPLGRWMHQQRKARRTGDLDRHRIDLLDQPEAGMVWEPGNEAWENKLKTRRPPVVPARHRAPRPAAGRRRERPRRTAGRDRAADRRPPPPPRPQQGPRSGGGARSAADRDRHRLELPLATGLATPPPQPRRPRRRRTRRPAVRHRTRRPHGRRRPRTLAPTTETAGHLEAAGERAAATADRAGRHAQTLSPAPADTGTAKGPGKAGNKAQAAFQRGLTALTQWVEREGQRPVPRGAIIEITVDGEPEPVPVRLGV